MKSPGQHRSDARSGFKEREQRRERRKPRLEAPTTSDTPTPAAIAMQAELDRRAAEAQERALKQSRLRYRKGQLLRVMGVPVRP